MSDRPAPAASPFRIHLDQQRKRAKELLRALRAREAEALARFRRHHPRAATLRPDALARLAEAQLVIARELGLPSWPRLVAHVAESERSAARIRQGGPAPDGEMPTWHLRCGSDIAPALREAGFTGDFLEYADPLCQGPVLDTPDWLERRAAFLAESYGAALGFDAAAALQRLRREEAGLQADRGPGARIVLWFEHDSYDQLILARCLAHFAAAPPARLELVSAGAYPGAARFIGLGQLPPEALRLLWEQRLAVPADALLQGAAAWQALRAPEPGALAALAAERLPALPALAPALRRHLQELPWLQDGLGLTERLVLQLLAEAPRDAGALFQALMREREPLPWMTDLMLLDLLRRLRHAAEPAIAGDGAAPERFHLTEAGRAVLGGARDALSLRPAPRFVGGVAIPGGPDPCWRWDEAAGRPVRA
ncbi:DUF1835 domain-containing protein [Pseudoroseomonas cervicalis]|uniref:DUF1835 domain-containing protein n=1 Tax=Teichococcus cervicalis TaxID=204525 RepID=UPI00278243C6|nr:DUF1835 domain-containing protein [Pseudoroseomonas cervicalis]MDQ1079170.1 hypothetical protein [Pseudoroseomonas cervicalis]